MQETVLREGENCWRVARAGRVGLLVDGDDYFSAFAAAAERATHSILILSWDFNSRTRLNCDEPSDSEKARLGDFLNFLARRRRSKLRGILLRRGLMPLFDSGAGGDPFIGGLNDFL